MPDVILNFQPRIGSLGALLTGAAAGGGGAVVWLLAMLGIGNSLGETLALYGFLPVALACAGAVAFLLKKRADWRVVLAGAVFSPAALVVAFAIVALTGGSWAR